MGRSVLGRPIIAKEEISYVETTIYPMAAKAFR